MVYEEIKNKLSGQLDGSWVSFDMLVLELPAGRIADAVECLKGHFGFDLLLDITAVDYPERTPRFELVYHFYSSEHRVRVRLKAGVAENDAKVPTLTQWYGSARYLERETHEMYGILFEGNDDLRPILLYEGFEGHPLRKDYPIDLEQPLVPYRK